MKLKSRRTKPKPDRSTDKSGKYQQGKEYQDHMTTLDDTPKDIEDPFGFFSFPQDFKGRTDFGKRKFLVFYFDDAEDYDRVLKYLGDHTKRFNTHPQTDTDKLCRMVEERIADAGKE
jgi:hypothetical protein